MDKNTLNIYSANLFKIVFIKMISSSKVIGGYDSVDYNGSANM